MILNTSRIHQSGNSLVVTLPTNVLASLAWERGDTVSLSVAPSGMLLVRRITPARVEIKSQRKK